MSELDVAERTLALATGEAQVTVRHERSLTARFARSAPSQCTAVDDLDVEVTCVVDGHCAAASTNSTADHELRRTAARARAGAEATARMSARSGSYPGLPPPAPAPSHPGFDAATAQLDPAASGAALTAAFAAAARHRLEAFGIWTAGVVSTAIVNTQGVQARDVVTDAHMRVICRDGDGRSGFAAETATSATALDGAGLAERAAAKADPRPPAELKPGAYEVVLEPEAVGTLLDFLGDLAFNGLAHAEGRGALAGRLGTQVAAPCINLADSPRDPATLPRAIDAEGVPKAPLPLIQDGVARAVVHDTRSAARAGAAARSTGHALAAGSAPAGPVPVNLVLGGGGCADERELAAPIERGLYVTRLWYVNTLHERETLLTGMTRDGTFLIEDGRIGPPLRELRFTDSVLRILASTQALTAGARLVSEAGLYGRRFAHGTVCPALRADGFRITGATSG